jgi:hypothetical protein
MFDRLLSHAQPSPHHQILKKENEKGISYTELILNFFD